MHAEVAGELCEVTGLLRALPIRQRRTAVDVEKVRSFVRQQNLFEQLKVVRQLLYDQKLLGETAVCETCITAWTKCVTSCNSSCITACTSECINSCTACVSNDVTGCLDTLAMQSLFNKPEKTGDPIDLKILADRIEIEW